LWISSVFFAVRKNLHTFLGVGSWYTTEKAVRRL
jgi:hypothetical protein